MERASHPADSTDRSNAPAMPEVHSDAYDWQGLANNPGLGKRFKFWLEALWQGIERNWQEDCSDQNARFLWVAVFMGFGAALYYVLPDEPSFWGLLAASLALCGWVYHRAAKGRVVFPLLLVTAIVVGVCAASEHGHFSTSPVLDHSLSSPVVGRLVRVEQRGTAKRPQERWTIAVETIEKLRPERTPKRLLLIRRGGEEQFRVGTRLRMWAHLTPLLQPVYPGSFDYGRYLWSRSIGGQGYLSNSIERLPEKTKSGWQGLVHDVRDSIERTRQAVARYILHRVDGEAGGFAVALAVGKRDFLADNVETSLRRSGLAHILAISGLHMALVAMSVFWGVRGILALLPQLSLHYPIKQWAAGMALFCAAAYLVFSGASVATIRAFCMTAIFLIAILAGRPAVTMHNLGLVMVLLILVQPYGVVEAGMQMSFAATAALIASYDRLTRLRLRKNGALAPSEHGLVFGSALHAGRWIIGIGLTSLIASLAVLPLSVAHFQQMAPFGLVANLLAMPLISLIVMPMGLVAVFMTPFGLQSWPLQLVEWGLDWVISMATMVSQWGDADYLVVKAGGDFLPFALAALAVYTIHRKWLSWLAVVPLTVAAALWWFAPQPDIWIAQTGTRVASRDIEGHWQRTGGRGMTLDYRSVLRADGDARALGVGDSQDREPKENPLLLQTSACDRQACFVTSLNASAAGRSDLSLAIVNKASAFSEECALRDIIVSRLPVPQSCKGPTLVIGADRLSQSGAQFLYLHKQDEQGLLARLAEDYFDIDGSAGDEKISELARNPHWRIEATAALPVGKRPWVTERR
ncbi:competence protein ComEC [Cohaesibacter marisflavi]|uniref:Competence protein ComEC n=1 Tax=Cohaesibacter marisflavi TaxID=655353 RepID=A0A1I5FKV1_9HYPH|nr:ComEC/Rec2 family competence protein [Cohaesibacter marisflavi]SFO24408.1 competence protein ComEC [Cohaesibacter marisflavi]